MSEPISLRFGPKFQEAIVGYMMREYPFLLQCVQHLKAEWFHNPDTQVLVKKIFEIYGTMTTKRLPTPLEIREALHYQYIADPAQVRRYQTHMVECDKAREQMGLDFIASRMTSWIRLIKLRNSIVKAEVLYNAQEYEQATVWLKNTMAEIENTTFEPSMAVDFSNPAKLFENREKAFERCSTLGDPQFDEMLRKNAKKVIPNGATSEYISDIRNQTHGCLVPGDTTLLMGATNSGKTTTVVTIVAANVKFDRKVLFITHEQKPEDIRAKLYLSATGIPGDQLSHLRSHPELLARAEVAYEEFFSKNLTYISHLKPGDMYVESVMNLIATQQESLMARNGGQGYDLVVVDYPGKLKSKTYTGRNVQTWDEQAYIYNQFVVAAGYYRFHALLPVQSNREGFKVNRGDADRFLDAGDVANSYGITQVVDNILTIRRNDAEKQKNIINFYLSKSRLSETGWVFQSMSDMALSRSHGFGLGKRVYHSSSPAEVTASEATMTPTSGMNMEKPRQIIQPTQTPNPYGQKATILVPDFFGQSKTDGGTIDYDPDEDDEGDM